MSITHSDITTYSKWINAHLDGAKKHNAKEQIEELKSLFPKGVEKHD